MAFEENKDGPIHRYVNGGAYRAARGRQLEQGSDRSIVDSRCWRLRLAVVNLDDEDPNCEEFVRLIVREMRIRFYASNSVRNYASALVSFLRFCGRRPKELEREHVKQYLEYLVDSKGGANKVSLHLAAIRGAFDKMCFRDLTLGLVTPRLPKRLPVVVSRPEIQRLLAAAGSLRDTLLIGLMYATGMRVSEVVRVRFEDLDFDRNTIRIRQSKGRSDRLVMLPTSFRELLASIAEGSSGNGFLFPSQPGPGGSERREAGRFLSPRTVQRVLERASTLGKLRQKITPHMLRHAFATHSFEDGCDVRRIQKVLGHLHLETTTIYVRVADPVVSGFIPSPADRILAKHSRTAKAAIGAETLKSAGLEACGSSWSSGTSEERHEGRSLRKRGQGPKALGSAAIGNRNASAVGSFRLDWSHSRFLKTDEAEESNVAMIISAVHRTARIEDIRVRQPTTGGWLRIEFPPGEVVMRAIRDLPAAVRERVERIEFMQLVERQIAQEFMSRSRSGDLQSSRNEREACALLG
ncbi:MAG: tyrosine-type recombinase/integrase [Aureliella sp.]